jgi:hypothetical protein
MVVVRRVEKMRSVLQGTQFVRACVFVGLKYRSVFSVVLQLVLYPLSTPSPNNSYTYLYQRR